jgi:cob(I)alamin adenosyltransferase
MVKRAAHLGDEGYTGFLGPGRLPKHDIRLEALGTIDEAMAALGVARASTTSKDNAPLLLEIQRDLYRIMAEVAAAPENAARFRTIDGQRVAWLEQTLNLVSSQVEMPKEFIIPGDQLSGAAMDLARAVVRRAERRVAQLLHMGLIENGELLRYLNRLSSLCFILELVEIRSAGIESPTPSKTVLDQTN